MSDEKARDALEALLNGVEAGVASARHILKGSAAPPEAAHSWTWSPSRIPWKNATGGKGPYERAKDPESGEFRELVKDLNAHKGSLAREEFYYWLFPDGTVVGRRRNAKT